LAKPNYRPTTSKLNEATKLAGDRNAWRSTVLNLGCQRAETSSSPRHRRWRSILF